MLWYVSLLVSICHECILSFIFPDPLQYECETSTIGDYVCDSSNNNQYCEFDGGDCCTGDDIWCSNCDGDSCNCHETGESKCIGSCSSGIDILLFN